MISPKSDHFWMPLDRKDLVTLNVLCNFAPEMKLATVQCHDIYGVSCYGQHVVEMIIMNTNINKKFCLCLQKKD